MHGVCSTRMCVYVHELGLNCKRSTGHGFLGPGIASCVGEIFLLKKEKKNVKKESVSSGKTKKHRNLKSRELLLLSRVWQLVYSFFSVRFWDLWRGFISYSGFLLVFPLLITWNSVRVSSSLAEQICGYSTWIISNHRKLMYEDDDDDNPNAFTMEAI